MPLDGHNLCRRVEVRSVQPKSRIESEILKRNSLNTWKSNNKKTHNLYLRDVLFPPNRFLQLWLERRQKIVAVHKDMYKAVYNSQKNGVASYITKKKL